MYVFHGFLRESSPRYYSQREQSVLLLTDGAEMDFESCQGRSGIGLEIYVN